MGDDDKKKSNWLQTFLQIFRWLQFDQMVIPAWPLLAGIILLGVSVLLSLINFQTSGISTNPPTSTILLTPSPIYTAYPTLTPIPLSPNTGRLEITYPMIMKLDEGDFISAEIITDPALNLSSPNATGLISIEKRSNNGKRNQYVAEIKLAPIMITELQAQNFEVSNNTLDNRRIIKAGTPVGWVWNITAKKVGEQTILVNVYSQIESNGEKSISLTKASSINIQVEDKSFFEKTFGFFAQNIVPILGTGGPLGLILAYLVYRSNREKQKLEDKLKEAENKIKELQLGLPPTSGKEEEKQKRPKRK